MCLVESKKYELDDMLSEELLSIAYERIIKRKLVDVHLKWNYGECYIVSRPGLVGQEVLSNHHATEFEAWKQAYEWHVLKKSGI